MDEEEIREHLENAIKAWDGRNRDASTQDQAEMLVVVLLPLLIDLLKRVKARELRMIELRRIMRWLLAGEEDNDDGD
jgi:hypothetical protein